ncbi:MAG: TMEM43 family protein [Thermoanaerobaculales bacterium]|nr:TMEM43 family protein [Thermoanaerobaculales bacterium]
MGQDSFTEVSGQGWFSRIGSSIKGIFFGLLLVLVSFLVLFWNEGRAVKRYKTLKEGGGTVISINSGTVNLNNNGRLIHLSGRADTSETLMDNNFGVSRQALKLKRTVLMFQWQESTSSETKKKIGGGTETTTTYNYNKEWSERPIDSSRFKHPEDHRNPGSMPYQTTEYVAGTVSLGSFRLSPYLVGRIDNYSKLTLDQSYVLPENLQAEAHSDAGGLYIGRTSAGPEIGDMKVSFAVVLPADVSIVAQQVENTFEPYRTKVGGTIELLQLGTISADAMFHQAQQSNKMMTWILRGLGLLMMFIGLRMILTPLSVIADVLPIAGTIVGAGIGIVSFLTALAFSFLTIAFAWIFFRPLIGVTMLVVFGVLVFLIVKKLRKVDLPPLPVT